MDFNTSKAVVLRRAAVALVRPWLSTFPWCWQQELSVVKTPWLKTPCQEKGRWWWEVQGICCWLHEEERGAEGAETQLSAARSGLEAGSSSQAWFLSKVGAPCWPLRPLPAEGAEQRIRALVWQCRGAPHVGQDRSTEESRGPWDGSAGAGRPSGRQR